MNDNYDLTRAERQLIDLVRGRTPREFTFTITCIHGRWTARTVEGPYGKDAEQVTVGAGPTFADAWLDQADPRWRGPLTFSEQARLGRVRVIDGDADL